jgi:hypothetical protein
MEDDIPEIDPLDVLRMRMIVWQQAMMDAVDAIHDFPEEVPYMSPERWAGMVDAIQICWDVARDGLKFVKDSEEVKEEKAAAGVSP